MKSLPCLPKHTVVFFPSRMNVKTSPYYRKVSTQFPERARRIRSMYLFSTAKEELVGVNAVNDGTTEERNPVKY